MNAGESGSDHKIRVLGFGESRHYVETQISTGKAKGWVDMEAVEEAPEELCHALAVAALQPVGAHGVADVGEVAHRLEVADPQHRRLQAGLDLFTADFLENRAQPKVTEERHGL